MKQEPFVLNSRQKAIVTMLAQGKTQKEIAAELKIGHRWVEDLIENIRKELNCVNAANIVAVCITRNLIDFNSENTVAMAA